MGNPRRNPTGSTGYDDAMAGISEAGMAYVQTGSKMKAVTVGLGAAIKSSLLGPLAILSGSLMGSIGLMSRFIKETQAVRRGLEEIKTVQMVEKQFEPLLRGAGAAKARVQELYAFAARTPFRFGEIAQASKQLEVFTRGALSTGKGLTMVGDAAAVSGDSIETVAMWVGRLYDSLKAGRPVGEAAFRLQEMGLFSGELRNKLETLQDSGASFSNMWQVVQGELSRTTGGMDRMSKSIGGLESTLADARAGLEKTLGSAFMDSETKSLESQIAIYNALTPVVQKYAEIVAWIETPITANIQSAKKWAAESGLLATTADWLAKSFIVLGSAIAATQTAVTIGWFVSLNRQMKDGATIAGKLAGVVASLAGGFGKLLSGLSGGKINIFQNISIIGLTTALQKAGSVVRAFAGMMLAQVGAALKVLAVNPVTWVAAAAAGFTLWVQSLEQAHEEVVGINKAGEEMAADYAKQIGQLQTITQKMEMLTKLQNDLATKEEEIRKAREDGADSEKIAALELQASHIRLAQTRLKSIKDASLVEEKLREIALSRLMLEKEIAEIRDANLINSSQGEEKIAALKAKQAELEQRAAKAAKEQDSSALHDRRMERDDIAIADAEFKLKIADKLFKTAQEEMAKGPEGDDYVRARDNLRNAKQVAYEARLRRDDLITNREFARAHSGLNGSEAARLTAQASAIRDKLNLEAGGITDPEEKARVKARLAAYEMGGLKGSLNGKTREDAEALDRQAKMIKSEDPLELKRRAAEMSWQEKLAAAELKHTNEVADIEVRTEKAKADLRTTGAQRQADERNLDEQAVLDKHASDMKAMDERQKLLREEGKQAQADAIEKDRAKAIATKDKALASIGGDKWQQNRAINLSRMDSMEGIKIAELEAQVSRGVPGSNQALAAARDKQAFGQNYRRFREEMGYGEKEARDLALRATNASIAGDFQRNLVTDSMTSAGLNAGGGYGGDNAAQLLQRQNQLATQANAYLAEIAAKVGAVDPTVP